MISAATMENQMPSSCQKSGKISTDRHWNTNVLRNEIKAETRPSPSAVKKEEPKMAKPENKKEKENRKRKPEKVILAVLVILAVGR